MNQEVPQLDSEKCLSRVNGDDCLIFLDAGFRERLKSYAIEIGYDPQSALVVAERAMAIFNNDEIANHPGTEKPIRIFDVETRLRDMLRTFVPIHTPLQAVIVASESAAIITAVRSKLFSEAEANNPMPINSVAYRVAPPPNPLEEESQ